MLIEHGALVFFLASFASCAYVHDLPILNATTTTTTPIEPLHTAVTTSTTPLSQQRVRLESTATITGLLPEETTTSERRLFKPHIEYSATITELAPDYPASSVTANNHAIPSTTTSLADVGAVIKSIFGPGWMTLIAHLESSASNGFGYNPEPTAELSSGEESTSTDARSTKESSIPDVPEYVESLRSHLESSVQGGFGEDIPITKLGTGPLSTITHPPTTSPVTYRDHTLEPVPGTQIIVGDTTLRPGETATIGDGQNASVIKNNPMGGVEVIVGTSTSSVDLSTSAPVTIGDQIATPITSGLVIGGKTLSQGGSPITVGPEAAPTTLSIDQQGRTMAAANGVTSAVNFPVTQVVNIGKITATAVKGNFQWAIDSSTLVVGQPITIDGMAVSITTNDIHSTVLIGSGFTTTLPAPEPTEPSVSTQVVSGTTKYIINSQTLYPGHPITLQGTLISVSTMTSGSTMLVVGNITTIVPGQSATHAPAVQTTLATTKGAGVAAMNPESSKPTSGAEKGMKRWNAALAGVTSAAILLLGFG
ncbi:hypothetical protein CC78DRAFT_565129 [Lojkania enalia]|uniref:Uncharacterized protein n=1 Tax=Lojkania enalia TaxID=147567 RepID=A0A9P4N9E8_9PLEO|nr:hypothetical protein CC78DRAFT_565129 [Didymosphaeria enalia]